MTKQETMQKVYSQTGVKTDFSFVMVIWVELPVDVCHCASAGTFVMLLHSPSPEYERRQAH